MRRFSEGKCLGVFVLWAATCVLAVAEEPKHGTFKTKDNVNIHYMEVGQGPPVVLIHGFTGSAQGNWFSNGVAEALAKNHRVIAIDCRNHGQSDKPQPGGSGRASDVVEMMDHLKIPKAHIHGYSMGGAETGQLLGMIPERMITASFGGSGLQETDPELRSKLAALNPRGTDPQEAEASRKLRIRNAMDNGMSQADAEKAADAPRAARGARGERGGAAAGGAAPAAGRNAAAATDGAPAAGGRSGVDLTKLNIPMLVINGEFDSPITKSTRILREVRDSKAVVLPGKSHLTAISGGYIPPLYITTLVDFINAHDPK